MYAPLRQATRCVTEVGTVVSTPYPASVPAPFVAVTDPFWLFGRLNAVPCQVQAAAACACTGQVIAPANNAVISKLRLIPVPPS
ncbi:hypothetical protein GCM10010174_17340 [Kutzneria viridogrisea]